MLHSVDPIVQTQPNITGNRERDTARRFLWLVCCGDASVSRPPLHLARILYKKALPPATVSFSGPVNWGIVYLTVFSLAALRP